VGTHGRRSHSRRPCSRRSSKSKSRSRSRSRSRSQSKSRSLAYVARVFRRKTAWRQVREREREQALSQEQAQAQAQEQEQGSSEIMLSVVEESARRRVESCPTTELQRQQDRVVRQATAEDF
jgi:hypothetical protein